MLSRPTVRAKLIPKSSIREYPFRLQLLDCPLPQPLLQLVVMRQLARNPKLGIRNDVFARIGRRELVARDRKERRQGTLGLIIQHTQTAHQWDEGLQDG